MSIIIESNGQPKSNTQQAHTLYALGFHRAAFCIYRVAIEQWLIAMTPEIEKGRLNTRANFLKKIGVLNSWQRTKLQDAIGICNAAAHGETLSNLKLRIFKISQAVKIIEAHGSHRQAQQPMTRPIRHRFQLAIAASVAIVFSFVKGGAA